MNKSTICYVSAYIDIGRKDWKTFSRTFDAYLKAFMPYITMFQRMTPDELKTYRMVVFVDDRYAQRVKDILPLEIPIQVICCSRSYLEKNIQNWSYLDISTQIIQSDYFRYVVGERVNTFPEHSKAEYVVVTTSKIDFVVRAMEFIDSDYFCWVDFGYFQYKGTIPKRPLDLNKLDLDRINIQLLSPLDQRDYDILYTMKHAPEKIAGAFVFGHRTRFLEYYELHHTTQKRFHMLGLVDDDQHLALQCYVRNPDLFRLHIHPFSWHKSLCLFQKDSLISKK